MFFTPLDRTQIQQIVDLLLEKLHARLADKQLTLTLTSAARDKLLDMGYDPVYGARPMKRLIQSRIETLVARKLIEGAALPGDTLVVDAADSPDGFSVSIQK